MHMRKCVLLCAALVAVLLGPGVRPLGAQTFESIGVRAQGMAVAFVALADDAKNLRENEQVRKTYLGET